MLLFILSLILKVLGNNQVCIDHSLLSHGQKLVVGFTLLLDLVTIGKSLLAIELVLFDQIGPCFLTSLIASLKFLHFLPQVYELSTLFFEHLLTIGIVGIRA